MKPRLPTGRLAVTLILPIIAWSAQRLLLPGIEGWKLDLLTRQAGRAADLSGMSVVSLGLGPAISGFVLVELVALLIPRWRQLRRGTPDERRSLRHAAIIVTLLLATIQAWFVATFLQQRMPFLPGETLIENAGLASKVLMTLTLVGGTCFLLGLAWLMDRYGLGNGFSVLLAAAAVPAAIGLTLAIVQAANEETIAARDILTFVLELAAVVFATWWILTLHRKLQPHLERPLVALRAPTSGIVPIIVTASLLVLPARLANVGVHIEEAAAPLAPGTTIYAVAQVVLISVLCFAFTRAFNNARTIGIALDRVDDESKKNETLQPAVTKMIRAGILRSLLFLVGVGVVVPAISTKPNVPLALDVLLCVTATAVVMDLFGEWRARKQYGSLVEIWPLHQVALLGAATEALTQAGIPVHARGAHHRSLLHFFAPYIPIDLLVPEQHTLDAQRLLHRVLIVSRQ